MKVDHHAAIGLLFRASAIASKRREAAKRLRLCVMADKQSARLAKARRMLNQEWNYLEILEREA